MWPGALVQWARQQSALTLCLIPLLAGTLTTVLALVAIDWCRKIQLANRLLAWLDEKS